MQTDLPHTLLNRGKSEGKNGGKNGGKKSFSYNPDDPAIKKQLEANRRKKERLEAKGLKPEYTMEEIFNR